MQQKKELRVTLDACIIFQLAACDTLLHTAEQNLFKPIWSEQILNEVLATSQKVLDARQQIGVLSRIEDMNTNFKASLFQTRKLWIENIQSILPDPKDAHVVALAIEAGSKLIVTENLRDFPNYLLQPLGIQAVSFDGFMTLIFESDPKAVIDGLEKLVSRKTNPPLSILEHLLQLERLSPNFNKEVRGYL